jgi:glycosyltransferase involved in cell wall biosynthesis
VISVVLPTHNRASMLVRAVASVLGQSHADLELIVVDDGSADATAEVLAAVEDPRLRVIRRPRRGGAAAARNAGIAAARGELVAFQDSDDEWTEHKLERQLQLLHAHGGDLGAVGGRWRTADGAEFRAPALESGGGYERELLDGNCLITPVWLIRRELLERLGGFDEQMSCLEDWDLMLRLSRRAPLRAVAETVLVKHGAPDSLGADPAVRAPALEQILERHRQRFRAWPRRRAALTLEAAQLYRRSGERRRALRCGALAVARAVPSLRAGALLPGRG